jgi:hypothetical protein
MVYGRPLMISPKLAAEFEFPTSTDEDAGVAAHSDTIGTVPNDAHIDIYVHSLRMILVLGEILDCFYIRFPSVEDDASRDSDSDDSAQSRFASIMRFDSALVDLQKAWPAFLQLADSGAPASRQALTMRAR